MPQVTTKMARLCCWGLQLVILVTVLSRSTQDVFSSSIKLTELAELEGKLLHACLKHEVTLDFPTQRFADTRRTLLEQARGQPWNHPNSAYLMMSAFVTHWNNLITSSKSFQKIVQNKQVELPAYSDVVGSWAAILRLQRIYNLTSLHISEGNYDSLAGPALSPMDAFQIGSRAFSDGMLQQSVEWLELSRSQIGTPRPTSQAFTSREAVAVLALLGRVYTWAGRPDKGRSLYEESVKIDTSPPSIPDVTQLGIELETMTKATHRTVHERDILDPQFASLCTRPKNDTVGPHPKPYHRCRYKSSLLIPYVRYQEEILSLVPYVSLFYNVIHDSEVEYLKAASRPKFSRAILEGNHDNYRRTSDLGWIEDNCHSPVPLRLSKRVRDLTWLEGISKMDKTRSAEDFQVVNYGLGGHYSPHFDPLVNKSLDAFQAQGSGTRIATFLLYLTDVDIGGHTVFINANISVAPVKGMGLFWYNMRPDMKLEPLTLHAGCPVLKGQKWIANKWIREYGNTFRRPCGLRDESTQLQVEKLTYQRRRDITYVASP